MQKMPVLFVGHGSPMNALEHNTFTDLWEQLGAALPAPKAILAVSAHWFVPGSRINDTPTPELVYDMYGFPPSLYQVRYPAPGAPELAHRVQALAGPGAVQTDNSWGIDHGTWSVLCRIFPSADITLCQLSVDRGATMERHYNLGKALAPLREEGVLILASGNVVHNLRLVDWDHSGGLPWADEFDESVKQHILAGDDNAVIHYEKLGAHASLAVPTPDHYAPLLYALGARDGNDRVHVFNNARTLGSLSMTGYLFTDSGT
jgi:4,5-DOPA dioxygenase extradiol